MADRPGRTVFLASRNPKKLAELERILAQHVPGVVVVGLDQVAAYDEPVEDQPDFEGNALLKARAGLAATGLPTLADDSGLCVDALNAMPGVLSARWAGTPKSDARNNELLLAQIADVPDERRAAHFTSVVAFCHPDGTTHLVQGQMPGRIVRAPRGAGGFGYDVVFVADDLPELDGREVTTAELDPADKDRISHRGRALAEIAPLVAASLDG